MNIKRLLLGALLTASVSAMAAAGEAPRYVFYFIGDGMGMGPVMTAQAYNRDILRNDKPLTMMQFPVVSWCMTYSASHSITDSAAAGTALSTGHKTRNGMLGMDPDTVAVTSIARQFKDAGYGVGVVTSVAPDDATPGAFYAHVPYRKMYYDIDIQAAYSDYDFLAGAGLLGVVDANGNPTDVLDVMEQRGVQMVYGPDEISTINSEKVFLVNPRGTSGHNIGYTIDSIPGVLTLPLITETCLDHLMKQSPERFFMMVEGGNIDHALHGNDGGAAIKEVLNFDQALRIAYNFYLEHPDETLILVTADHDTGGMANVHSRTGQHMPLSVFDYQKVSKEAFSDYCKSILHSRRVYTWEDMKEYLEENLGLFTHIPVSDDRLETLKDMFEKTFELRNSADQQTLYASFNAFAVEVFKLVNDAAGVAFTTVSHSGNPVPVFAVGVGSERFHSLNDNYLLPQIIREICSLPAK
ncbi:MAG: alkaline phosphatase [Muribaculaceae bacterium]|nr:alkaline phosphatase [Muribaculaceae bacterium]